jgi:hypothetical protein
VGTASRRDPARLSPPFLRDDFGELRGLRRCHRRQTQTIAGENPPSPGAHPGLSSETVSIRRVDARRDAHAQGTLRTRADGLSYTSRQTFNYKDRSPRSLPYATERDLSQMETDSKRERNREESYGRWAERRRLLKKQ